MALKNLGSGLGKTQRIWQVKPATGIPTIYLLIIGSPKAKKNNNNIYTFYIHV